MNNYTDLEAPSVELAAAAAQFGIIQWRDDSNQDHTAPFGSALLDQELYLAQRARVSNRYPHKRSYIGLHHFSSTGSHVWHESLLEAQTLAWLDMAGGIVAIAAQPLKITFADGTGHFPDYFALHADHRQVLYDVKPAGRITPKVRAQFAKTRALCERIGWGYEVCVEPSPQARVNVDFLSAFRHHGYHPGAERAQQLRLALVHPMPLDAAAKALRQPLAEARAGIFHLTWTRELRLDVNNRITGKTLIERNDNAHA